MSGRAGVPGAGFEREYYETSYRNYARQNPPRKLAFYRRLVERAAAGIPNPSVLDVGCAFGAFLGALDPRWRRFGADVSQFAIEQARVAVPGATFACAGFGEIPFGERFDVVTAFDVIEHVPSLDMVASVVHSRLREGGHLIFVVPVYDGPTGPIIRHLDKDVTHLHKRSRDFWLLWAREKFVVLEWWGVYRYLFPGGYYAHHPTRVWRRLTPAIAVLARRRAE
jgi:SAM-dependent methyltransferase